VNTGEDPGLRYEMRAERSSAQQIQHLWGPGHEQQAECDRCAARLEQSLQSFIISFPVLPSGFGYTGQEVLIV
jgi:hypothetical protein